MSLLKSICPLVAGILLLAATTQAEELQLVRVSEFNSDFEIAATSGAFIPWGFNYDHDASGALLEDYWLTDWQRVTQDFAEMKKLGATVVRIHLQFGKFMQTAEQPNEAAIEQLGKLVRLAETTGLYLDVTGLGCYHKQDVPAWYDKLDEAGRWQAQANFWKAVAKTCANSAAIFCYDLMNEPVVPAGDKPGKDWLGPAFGDKHFVQYISLDRAGRKRPEIAKAWIKQLVAAVRAEDDQHMITVGLVPWSLDRPGLSSGFLPKEIAPELDFIAVHLYPNKDKLDDDLETLAGFDVGKPIVIEETFPLGCSPEELGEFITASQPKASGWIGFYWGETPEDYRMKKSPTIAEAITLGWLEMFEREGKKLFPK